MNAIYNQGSRGQLVRMGKMDLQNFDFADLDQEDVIKWVVVPGATIAALFFLTKVIKKRKRRRR